MNKELVLIQNGQPMTTSLIIAEVFEKRHADVITKIEKLECSKEFTERNFSLSEYKDSTGRNLKMYNITRDGFTMIVMGYTGEKALKFKEKYIEQFNLMYDKLKEIEEKVHERLEDLTPLEIEYKNRKAIYKSADLDSKHFKLDATSTMLWKQNQLLKNKLDCPHVPTLELSKDKTWLSKTEIYEKLNLKGEQKKIAKSYLDRVILDGDDKEVKKFMYENNGHSGEYYKFSEVILDQLYHMFN